MARIYSVVMASQTITAANGDVDWLEVIPADDKPVKLRGLLLSQTSEVGDAQEEGLRFRVLRLSAITSGSGGSAPTPVPVDSADAAAGMTTETGNTTLGNQIIKILNESIELTESIRKLFTRNIPENIEISESLLSRLSMLRFIIETIDITESVSRTGLIIIQVINDTLQVAESVTRLLLPHLRRATANITRYNNTANISRIFKLADIGRPNRTLNLIRSFKLSDIIRPHKRIN